MSIFNNFAFLIFLIQSLVKGQIISSRSFIVKLEQKSFSDAAMACISSFGTQLATIRTDNDQAELEELLSNSLIGSNNLYIGYKRANGNSNFVWEDSTPPSSYTNWANTFPSSGTSERCTQVISSGKWQDISCSTTLYYVCQIPNLYESANYVILAPRMSFDDARTFCKMTVGTDLASISDVSDRDELGELEYSISNYFYVWLGLNDIDVEGVPEWTDGTIYDNTICSAPYNDEDYDCTYLSAQYFEDCWEFHDCDESNLNSVACNRPETVTTTNFVVVESRLPFASSNAYCNEKYGTSLARIDDLTDNNEVANALIRTSRIGYNDRSVEGTFEWISGTSSYTNWCSGEPNNFQNREDCTIIFRNSNPTKPGCWRDDDCSTNRPFVCNRS